MPPLPCLRGVGQCLEVDLGLAAAGDAVEQEGARRGRRAGTGGAVGRGLGEIHRVLDGGQRFALGRVER